jgi:hypothetical protein
MEVLNFKKNDRIVAVWQQRRVRSVDHQKTDQCDAHFNRTLTVNKHTIFIITK